MYTLYKATNTINGKVYIGQTKQTLCKRINRHKANAKLKQDSTHYLSNAINKYGFKSFLWEPVLIVSSKEEADFYEVRIINLYKSNDKNFGYNLTFGGGGTAGYSHTEETKAKMSKSRTGHKVSQETRAKISKANKGKPKKDSTKMGLGMSKPVICLDTGMIFSSAAEAARELGIKSYSNICRVCSGERKTCNKLRWAWYIKQDR